MRKGWLLVIFFFLFINKIYPQRIISLQECRSLAIENNKQLKISDALIQSAYYQKKDAFTKYFPELSFTGAYLRNQKNIQLFHPTLTLPTSIAGIELPIPPGTEIPIPDEIRNIGKIEIKNIWVAGFGLVQPLFTGGKIVAYNDIVKNAEELAKTNKDTKLTDIIVDVDNSYWLVVSLSLKKQLAESFVSLMNKMEYDVIALEEEGMATKADRLSVSVKLNEAEVALTKVENGLSLAKMYLAQICGLDISDAYFLYDEYADNIGVYQNEMEIVNVETAVNNRTEIKSLDIVTNIMKGRERIAFSDFLPQIGLTANYLWTNPSSFDGFEKKFGGMWSVGVVMEVPLNFFSTSAKYKSAKAQTLVTEYLREDIKEKLELQVNESLFKINEANKMLLTAGKNTEKADENLYYADEGFKEGVISAADVMAAHTAWVSAHSEYIDAQINVKLAKVYLDKALGRTITE